MTPVEFLAGNKNAMEKPRPDNYGFNAAVYWSDDFNTAPAEARAEEAQD